MVDQDAILAQVTSDKTADRFKGTELLLTNLRAGKLAFDDPQEIIDILSPNFTDSNFRVAQYSLESTHLIILRDSGFLTKTAGQRILQLALERLSHARQQVKEASYSLCTLVLTGTIMSDTECNAPVLEQMLQHRNPAVKECTLQLIQECLIENLSLPYRQLARFLPKITRLLQDGAPNVRAQAANLLSICHEYYAGEFAEVDDSSVVGASVGVPRDSKSVSRSRTDENIIQTPVKTPTPRKASTPHDPPRITREVDTSASLFPPPLQGDPCAQSNPFSIVPPTQQSSYYSFKPFHTYTLPSKLDTLFSGQPGITTASINTLYNRRQPMFSSGMTEALAVIQVALAKSTDWAAQTQAIHALMGIVLIDSNIAHDDFSVELGGIMDSFLSQRMPALTTCLTSRRSTLSRETCLMLEMCCQRFGIHVSPSMLEILEFAVRLLNQKGVYCENSADSLIRTIICHCCPRAYFTRFLKHCSSEKSPHVRAHLLEYIALLVFSGMLHATFPSILDARDVTFWVRHEREIVETFKAHFEDPAVRVRQSTKCTLLLMKKLFPKVWIRTEAALGAKISALDSADLSGMFFQAIGGQQKATMIPLYDEEFPTFWLNSAAHHACISTNNAMYPWKVAFTSHSDYTLIWDDLCNINVQDTPSAFSERSSRVPSTNDLENVPIRHKIPSARNSGAKDMEDRMTKFARTEGNPSSANPRRKVARATDESDISTKNRYERGKSNTSENNKTILHGKNLPIRPATAGGRTLIGQKIIPDEDISISNSNDSDEIESLVYSRSTMMRDSAPNEYSAAASNRGSTQDSFRALLKFISDPSHPTGDIELSLSRLCDDYDKFSGYMAHVFAQTFLALLDLTKHKSLQVRRLSLNVLMLLCQRNAGLLVDFLDILINSLLELYKDPELSIRRAADSVLLEIVSTMDARAVFSIFGDAIQGDADGVVLHGSIRLLAKAARYYSSTDILLNDVGAVWPGLTVAFGSPNPDIRKAVVYCLVDLYFMLEDSFSPYLNELTASQLKLVMIYVEKLYTQKHIVSDAM